MTDLTNGCHGCGTLTEEHARDCRVNLLEMIERYGELRNAAGHAAGTWNGWASTASKDAEALLNEIRERLEEVTS